MVLIFGWGIAQISALKCENSTVCLLCTGWQLLLSDYQRGYSVAGNTRIVGTCNWLCKSSFIVRTEGLARLQNYTGAYLVFLWHMYIVERLKKGELMLHAKRWLDHNAPTSLDGTFVTRVHYVSNLLTCAFSWHNIMHLIIIFLTLLESYTCANISGKFHAWLQWSRSTCGLSNDKDFIV